MKNFFTGLAAVVAIGWSVIGLAVAASHQPGNDWNQWDYVAIVPWVLMILWIVGHGIWLLGRYIRT